MNPPLVGWGDGSSRVDTPVLQETDGGHARLGAKPVGVIRRTSPHEPHRQPADADARVAGAARQQPEDVGDVGRAGVRSSRVLLAGGLVHDRGDAPLDHADVVAYVDAASARELAGVAELLLEPAALVKRGL
jgi:hypothetical protein